jgi:hypothetical protein
MFRRLAQKLEIERRVYVALTATARFVHMLDQIERLLKLDLPSWTTSLLIHENRDVT